MPQVSLYGTRLCSFCAAARQLLNRKGVSYDDISVDQDLDLRNEVRQKKRTTHSSTDLGWGNTYWRIFRASGLRNNRRIGCPFKS